MKQILLINDMAGYGKVATAAMLPILSYLGHAVYNLPTALVSNTLDYGKFHILETTDYIEKVFPVWKDLGFSFDAISTGFIVSERQATMIADFCSEAAKAGTRIFVDPIMGDDGKLYNGVDSGRIEVMKRMLAVADLIVPNYTEACLLTGSPYDPLAETESSAFALVDKLRLLGSKSVVITSMRLDTGYFVVGYNHLSQQYFKLPFSLVDAHFPGTGDIFSAVLIGHLLNDDSLECSTRIAMDAVKNMVEQNKNNIDKNKGIPIEKYLNLL